ncbi:MAG: Sfum_1244 family protein [Thermodesulfobacteriota bacterium]
MDEGLISEIEPLRRQIAANCHRSDARFAGSFSLCSLLLRMRDYFKWDRDLPPWAEVDSPEVLAWIEERERVWDEAADEEIAQLRWRGGEIDAFDSETINQDIEPWGLSYGSGYAAFLKPSFFLAEVINHRQQGGFKVIYLGHELVRDLFTTPAQNLGGRIVARRRPLAAYLWDLILHAGGPRRQAVDLALYEYGLERERMVGPSFNWTPRFEKLLDSEVEAFVWHEIGEAGDQAFPRDVWRALIGAFPHSRLELMARTLKDFLADTSEIGRLKFIIDSRRRASLAIYLADLSSLTARLFPEIVKAYNLLIREGDWSVIEAARCEGRRKAQEMAREMVSLASSVQERPDWVVRRVEERFYQPLGL